MKKLIIVLFFLLVIQCFIPSYCSDTSDIIRDQEELLGISEFIKEAENYTKDNFDDIDLKSIYKNAITGKVEINSLGKRTSKISRQRVTRYIKNIRLYANYNNNP